MKRLSLHELKLWRDEVSMELAPLEYDLAKWQALLAWIDAEIAKLKEAA